ADADGNGIIDYDEFITATMAMNRMNREEHDGRDIKEIISEVDVDNVSPVIA
ncbi:calcium-dependent protein kinase 17-like, partial [Trifolium medium]|nr:calcium-dependent protein kinase 17-like [Trifolium medium]